jgi:hypothetical protein
MVTDATIVMRLVTAITMGLAVSIKKAVEITARKTAR